MLRLFIFCAAAIAIIGAASDASAQEARVRVGLLECHGAPAASFIVGSVRGLDCVFHADRGGNYRYQGLVRRVGLDIGITEGSRLHWRVFAPARRIGRHDLAGRYGGVTAGAAIGVGGNAYLLLGGSGNSIALQPLSVEGEAGLNVALGIADLELRPVEFGVRRRHRHDGH